VIPLYYFVAVTIDVGDRLPPERIQVLREVVCDAATAAGIPVEVRIFEEI
jgi:hypothetical protein